MALFTTALGLYGGVLWSGELQGFIIHEMVPTNRFVFCACCRDRPTQTHCSAFERTHIVGASHCFTQLVAAWRTPPFPFPCNAHLTHICGFRYSPW
jgi:hypothetical protein